MGGALHVGPVTLLPASRSAWRGQREYAMKIVQHLTMLCTVRHDLAQLDISIGSLLYAIRSRCGGVGWLLSVFDDGQPFGQRLLQLRQIGGLDQQLIHASGVTTPCFLGQRICRPSDDWSAGRGFLASILRISWASS